MVRGVVSKLLQAIVLSTLSCIFFAQLSVALPNPSPHVTSLVQRGLSLFNTLRLKRDEGIVIMLEQASLFKRQTDQVPIATVPAEADDPNMPAALDAPVDNGGLVVSRGPVDPLEGHNPPDDPAFNDLGDDGNSTAGMDGYVDSIPSPSAYAAQSEVPSTADSGADGPLIGTGDPLVSGYPQVTNLAGSTPAMDVSRTQPEMTAAQDQGDDQDGETPLAQEAPGVRYPQTPSNNAPMSLIKPDVTMDQIGATERPDSPVKLNSQPEIDFGSGAEIQDIPEADNEDPSYMDDPEAYIEDYEARNRLARKDVSPAAPAKAMPQSVWRRGMALPSRLERVPKPVVPVVTVQPVQIIPAAMNEGQPKQNNIADGAAALPYIPFFGRKSSKAPAEPVPGSIGGTRLNVAATATGKMNLPLITTGSWSDITKDPYAGSDWDMMHKETETVTITIGKDGKLPPDLPPDVAAAISAALGAGLTSFPFFPGDGNDNGDRAFNHHIAEPTMAPAAPVLAPIAPAVAMPTPGQEAPQDIEQSFVGLDPVFAAALAGNNLAANVEDLAYAGSSAIVSPKSFRQQMMGLLSSMGRVFGL